MPQKFKALVTVSVWALFVGAWLAGLLTFIVGGIIGGAAFSIKEVPMSYFAGYAVSIGFSFAAGFLVLVRKKLE
jgi:uncharacterized membrane protein YjjP (DUF1212 family)